MRNIITKALFLTVALSGVLSAQAAVITIPQSALTPSTTLYTDDIGGGIGSAVMGRNDDGSSAVQNFGFSLNFFGNTYSQYYINNNGNITFGSPLGSFTPSGPTGAPRPIISPFFADVDTRNTGSGLVYGRNDIADQIIVTWDRVGYYPSRANLLNTFQLVVRGPGYAVPTGEGDIGFFWTTMQWETGGASGGTNGFGGTPAAIGFGDGNTNGSVLQGSTTNGISGVVQNHRIWFNLSDSGTPVVIDPGTGGRVPEPSTLALFAAIALAAVSVSKRRTRA